MSSPNMAPTNFFDNVEAQDLPQTTDKKQPWTAFHAPQENLAKDGSVKCDVPSTESTGSYMGRCTGTGSLGGL
ncbi:MAG: hypothetical protein M1819_002306 [Sarea resinae]|nr:MAG: hypothetical protein M1819_002306 [Sarea resinae]